MGDEAPASDNPRLPPVEEVKALRAATRDWRLSRGDVAVYGAILQHCNADGESFPGPTRISKLIMLAITNVKISIKKLEAFRYIEVSRPGPRKKNRFKVTFKRLYVPPRNADKPSQLVTKKPRVVPISSREHIQIEHQAAGPTGLVGMHSTGLADMNQLGMPARHEVAFKSPSEITGATRSDSDLEKQQRRQEKEQRHRDGFRSEYQQTLLTHPQHARNMENNPSIRKYIEDLIQERAA